MNHYELKQQAKKERYQELAERAEQKSTQLAEKSSRMFEAIPFGQPILVGHHSEKRDRAYRGKAWNTMGQSVKESEKASYYENKAASVGKAGISSDDPEAVEKLKIKLAQLEDKQRDMKEQNAEARALKLEKPFPSFCLTNNGATIRNTKQRIEQLQKTSGMTVREDIIGNGYTIKEDLEDNRIKIIFDGKPELETRQLLKSHGFRWSPYNSAWQRMLNGNGRFSTDILIKKLK